jgi:hypothetical protein
LRFAIFALAGLLASLAAAQNTIKISVAGDPPEFRAEGSTILRRINNPNFRAIFQVSVEGQSANPILGSYEISQGVLVFKPRFPLDPGLTYQATFSLPGEQGSLRYTVPKPVIKLTTSVDHVYPSINVLPENQLKFYIHFTAPMSRGEGRKRIHLIEEGSGEVKLPFLELDEELWDREQRRLTVLFDPGRIKRGVTPNVEVGLPLKAGKRYKLLIDKEWPDAKGLPLTAAFTKEFTAAEADRTPLDPKQWKVLAPKSGGSDKLAIEFPEPLDAALLLRFIDVLAPDGKPIRGKVSLENQEQRWTFESDRPWQPGKYAIEVLSTLEDLAGNKVGVAFDVDRFEQVERKVVSESVTLPLVIE